MSEGQIKVYAPTPIDPDSWLNEDRFEDFRRAYAYACTQSAAIVALSRISPEEAFGLYFALERGMERFSGPKAPEQVKEVGQ